MGGNHRELPEPGEVAPPERPIKIVEEELKQTTVKRRES